MGGSGAIIAEKGEAIGAPKWSGSLAGQYDFAPLGRKLYARFDFHFIGARPRLDPRVYGNDSAISATEETRILNLRLGIHLHEWNLSVFADNVTNDEPVLSLGHDTLKSPIFTSFTYRPRTLGFTAVLAF